MAALGGNRDTVERQSPFSTDFQATGADSTQFYKGGALAINSSGLLQKALGSGGTTGPQTVGVCLENYLTGASNTRQIKGRNGIFAFDNGDSIVAADRGKNCYWGDDQTVYKSSSSGLRPPAGTIYDVKANGQVEVSISTPWNPGGSSFGATGP